MSKPIHASKVFDIFNSPAQIKCPYSGREECEGVPHLDQVRWGSGVVETSTSGHGLILDYSCEWGHKWRITTEDHSGGTWIKVEEI
jgi:hypothetical protein